MPIIRPVPDAMIVLQKDISCKIYYRRRRCRTLEIRIEGENEISFLAPRFLSLRKIKQTLEEKSGWIIRKLQLIKKQQIVGELPAPQEAEDFLFLGKSRTIEIAPQNPDAANVFLKKGKWQVGLMPGLSLEDKNSRVRAKLKKQLWAKAESILNFRIRQWAQRLNLEPEKVSVKDPSSLWGSCSRRTRRINLNWKIIMAPLQIIDYVIVHELCHLKALNHSPEFWGHVKSVLPDFKDRRRWLKENGYRLRLPLYFKESLHVDEH